MVEFQGHRHDSKAVFCNPPAAGSRELGNEASDMKAFEEAGNSSTLSFDFEGVIGSMIEMAANGGVAETVDRVFTAHNSSKEVYIIAGSGIERAEGTAIVVNRFDKTVEMEKGVSGVINDGEGIKITSIGGQRNLGITPKMGNTFRHGIPAGDLLPFTYASASDLEIIRAVNDGFNTQHTTELVIHLNPVLLHTMFNTSAWPTFFEITDDFAGETPVEFFTEEGHNVLGAETKSSVFQQFFVQGFEGVAIFKDNIGGKLSLVSAPVIIHRDQQVFEQGIYSCGEHGKNAGPLQLGKSVGETLGADGVFNLEENIIGARTFLPVNRSAVGNTVFVQFPSQPIVTIETYLDGEREPCLDSYMHKAKGTVNEVEIETKTFSCSRYDFGASFAVSEFETLTTFNSREHTDQSGCDTVFEGDFSGELFFSDRFSKKYVWPSGFSSCGLGMLCQMSGMFNDEVFEVLDKKTLSGDELFHGFSPIDGQMSLEHHPVKT